MPKVTKPVAQPGFKPTQENSHTFNHYIVLSHNNVGELMGGQRNGKLFWKECTDTADEFTTVNFNLL